MGHVVGWVSVTRHRGEHHQALCGTVSDKHAGALRDAAKQENCSCGLYNNVQHNLSLQALVAVLMVVSLVEHDVV